MTTKSDTVTNELKPCPWAVGNQTHVAFWEAVNRYVRACGGDTSGFNRMDPELKALFASTHRMSAVVDIEAIVFSIARHSRPSPAPTVSVEECVEAARVALRSEIPDVSDELTSPTSDELTCIAAVHALCVSRLTGAATRSETIEELALDLVNKWRESSGMRKRSNWAKTVSRDDDYDGGREPWLAVARCALASHPASVAGEARPSFEEQFEKVRDAFVRGHNENCGAILHKLDPLYIDASTASGLRAVMELYERGAK